MSQIRKALGEKANAPRFITTVSGQGYRFVGNVLANDDEVVIDRRTIQRITVEDMDEPESKRDALTSGSSVQRNRGLVVAGVCLLAALLVVGAFILRQRSDGNQPFQKISITRLTTTGKVRDAVLSPDGKLFAYVIDELGKRSLWVGYTAGGNDIQLRTAAETNFHGLAFSPDGAFVFFSIADDQNPTGRLFRIAAFGGAPEKILDGITNFSLSPDGKQVAVARQSDSEDSIVTVPLDGQPERTVVSFPRSKLAFIGPISWSPDAKRLAFSHLREGEFFRDDLVIADIGGGTIERVALDGWRNILKTAWLKNGDGLIVTAVAENSWSPISHFEILEVGLPGGEVRKVVSDLSSYDSALSLSSASEAMLTIEHRQLNNIWAAPAEHLDQARQVTFGSFGKYDGLWGLDWTPDGRIVFTNSDTDTQVISIMDPDGKNEKELTSPGFVDSALSVSKDGRYIVFHSNRGGYFDIWRMNIDGSDLKQLTFGNQGFQPFISPDSRYVYYKSWLDNVGRLCRVPIGGGEPEVITDRETSWGSFSPDGKYFAATYITDKRRLAIFSTADNRLVTQLEPAATGIFFNLPIRWTPDGRHIVYRDDVWGYWTQSIDGGEPVKLDGLPREYLYTFAWSKDGKQFAFVRGQELRDIVLISDVH
jgi:Tol biopolymer transport system component